MDSWMLLLDSAKVWEVGEEEKEEAGGWRKIREAREPRKNSVGKKEEAGGRKKRKEHLRQLLKYTSSPQAKTLRSTLRSSNILSSPLPCLEGGTRKMLLRRRA